MISPLSSTASFSPQGFGAISPLSSAASFSPQGFEVRSPELATSFFPQDFSAPPEGALRERRGAIIPDALLQTELLGILKAAKRDRSSPSKFPRRRRRSSSSRPYPKPEWIRNAKAKRIVSNKQKPVPDYSSAGFNQTFFIDDFAPRYLVTRA